jgi:translation initiation factor 2B subunit (eIF-2B alpha/beta/delta family)
MARNNSSSLAHSYLNVFSELLHRHNADRAIEKFSKHIEGRPMDVVSTNALFYVAHPSGHEEPAKELLSRTIQTKKHIDFCSKHLSEIASNKLKNKSVVVHPLDASATSFVKSAASIRFIQADQAALHNLPAHKLECHQPISAHSAFDNAHLLLLAPQAVTRQGAVVQKGGLLLAELASARGIPVYALATAWHTAPKWHADANNENIPAGLITGILSEHGIHSHKDFMANVKKDFPWII